MVAVSDGGCGSSALLPSEAGPGLPSVGEGASSSPPQQQRWRRRGQRRGAAAGGIGKLMTSLLVGGLVGCLDNHGPPWRGASAFTLPPPPGMTASASPSSSSLLRHRSGCHHPTRPPSDQGVSRLAAAAGCGTDGAMDHDCGYGGGRSGRSASRIIPGPGPSWVLTGVDRRVGGGGGQLRRGQQEGAAMGVSSPGPLEGLLAATAASWRRLVPSAVALLGPALLSPGLVRGEDELAQYAKEGNKVGVDARCFVQKCSLQTHECVNNPDCLKGLSCLSKCKGEGTCSTACFAKYGNSVLDDFLHCSVEKEDCVHVPRDRSRATWTDPTAVASNKMADPRFDIRSLEGRWYKVMGMDARYDCFDCQVNHFSPKPGQPDVMVADVQFRMPRPRAPGFWENHITEELLGDGPGARRSMHSVGRMFGLTFWENWYVIGENDPSEAAKASGEVPASSGSGGTTGRMASVVSGAEEGLPPYKFIYYTGHTLQGNYEGAFVYARTPELPPALMPHIAQVARANGLDPSKFCKIRNTCFRDPPTGPLTAALDADPAGMRLVTVPPPPPFSPAGIKAWAKARVAWFPQAVSELTARVNMELEDWFEDPIATSDWLIRQQERMILLADDPDVGGSGGTVAAATSGGTGMAAGPGPGASTALAKKSR